LRRDAIGSNVAARRARRALQVSQGLQRPTGQYGLLQNL